MIENGDKCPACGKLSMPLIRESRCTARMCQNSECRFIEELRTQQPFEYDPTPYEYVDGKEDKDAK
jgi:hypothetical protein